MSNPEDPKTFQSRDGMERVWYFWAVILVASAFGPTYSHLLPGGDQEGEIHQMLDVSQQKILEDSNPTVGQEEKNEEKEISPDYGQVNESQTENPVTEKEDTSPEDLPENFRRGFRVAARRRRRGCICRRRVVKIAGTSRVIRRKVYRSKRCCKKKGSGGGGGGGEEDNGGGEEIPEEEEETPEEGGDDGEAEEEEGKESEEKTEKPPVVVNNTIIVPPPVVNPPAPTGPLPPTVLVPSGGMQTGTILVPSGGIHQGGTVLVPPRGPASGTVLVPSGTILVPSGVSPGTIIPARPPRPVIGGIPTQNIGK